jgi:hypothetical protein
LGFLSSRELALVIWIGSLVALMFCFKNLRESMGKVLISLLNKQIGLILLSLIAFTVLSTFLLYKTRLWESSFVKDIIFWFFGFVLVTFYTINTAKSNNFFKKILKQTFKLTVLSEFILNFYTFSLAAELILLPVLLFLSMTMEFSKRDSKNKDVTSLLNYTLSLVGLGFLGYALYKTVLSYNMLFTYSNLKELLLPCSLSIAILPVFYLIAVYIEYEEFFIRTDQMTRYMGGEKQARKAVVLVAGINLRKISLISRTMNKSDLSRAGDFRDYFKRLVKID